MASCALLLLFAHFLLVDGLAPYTGDPPILPDRSPFGFGSQVTGGGSDNGSNTYLVDNMVDLRTALTMNIPRTVYVQGEIQGNEINSSFSADCQWYIDNSPNTQFNFTQYVMAYNETYMDEVEAAADAGGQIDGYDAAELYDLLKHQNGWRSQVQNVQKQYESINVHGDLTLVGMDASAWLHGVNLIFNTQTNIILRNLKLTSPRDCFPAPEKYPGTWNARYDAISMVTTTSVWIDGNILEDGSAAVAPDDFLWGWQVDRYDGLFDAEDGTDNVTFSHNVVANHHKSLLWGGGEKEGPRDLGAMRFTVFANHFAASQSRNPLMRFGTFYLVHNLYENAADQPPLFAFPNATATAPAAAAEAADYAPPFQYHLGVYNLSHVLVAGNAFAQTGAYPSDASRVFAFANLATPAQPARLCSPPDLSAAELAAYPALAGGGARWLPSALNGAPLDLRALGRRAFAYAREAGQAGLVAGGLATDCRGFVAQDVPRAFADADEVEAYVRANAGQVGQTTP